MKASSTTAPGQRGWDTVEDPMILDPTDAIVRVVTTTICGTDLHTLKGDAPETTILAHPFALDHAMAAYDTSADAADTNALKVVLQGAQGAALATRSTEAAVPA